MSSPAARLKVDDKVALNSSSSRRTSRWSCSLRRKRNMISAATKASATSTISGPMSVVGGAAS